MLDKIQQVIEIQGNKHYKESFDKKENTQKETTDIFYKMIKAEEAKLSNNERK